MCIENLARSNRTQAYPILLNLFIIQNRKDHIRTKAHKGVSSPDRSAKHIANLKGHTKSLTSKDESSSRVYIIQHHITINPITIKMFDTYHGAVVDPTMVV